MNKSLLCVIPANTIDVSKSSAEGARKDVLCVRLRIIYGLYETPDKRKNVSFSRKKVDFILLIFFTRFPSALVKI